MSNSCTEKAADDNLAMVFHKFNKSQRID